jgi:hypothetical protein
MGRIHLALASADVKQVSGNVATGVQHPQFVV